MGKAKEIEMEGKTYTSEMFGSKKGYAKMQEELDTVGTREPDYQPWNIDITTYKISINFVS